MEICKNLGLPIPMIPRLNQSNAYVKRKLQVWRALKCIALIGAETVLTSAKPQTTLLDGGQYRAETGKMRNFGPANPHGTAFVPKQCLYQNEATGMDSPKCIALLHGKTAPTRAGLQTTPFQGGKYRAENGKMRNFGPANPHGTAFAPKQCLYQN